MSLHVRYLSILLFAAKVIHSLFGRARKNGEEVNPRRYLFLFGLFISDILRGRKGGASKFPH